MLGLLLCSHGLRNLLQTARQPPHHIHHTIGVNNRHHHTHVFTSPTSICVCGSSACSYGSYGEWVWSTRFWYEIARAWGSVGSCWFVWCYGFGLSASDSTGSYVD
jgi:hypothetical protein